MKHKIMLVGIIAVLITVNSWINPNRSGSGIVIASVLENFRLLDSDSAQGIFTDHQSASGAIIIFLPGAPSCTATMSTSLK